jgi:hypothetical protein
MNLPFLRSRLDDALAPALCSAHKNHAPPVKEERRAGLRRPVKNTPIEGGTYGMNVDFVGILPYLAAFALAASRPSRHRVQPASMPCIYCMAPAVAFATRACIVRVVFPPGSAKLTVVSTSNTGVARFVSYPTGKHQPLRLDDFFEYVLPRIDRGIDRAVGPTHINVDGAAGSRIPRFTADW